MNKEGLGVTQRRRPSSLVSRVTAMLDDAQSYSTAAIFGSLILLLSYQ